MFRETADKIEEGRAALGRLAKLMDLPKLRKDIETREAESANPSFWADSTSAKKKSKELNDLKKLLGEYEKSQRSLEDLKAHLDLANEVQDAGELKGLVRRGSVHINGRGGESNRASRYQYVRKQEHRKSAPATRCVGHKRLAGNHAAGFHIAL